MLRSCVVHILESCFGSILAQVLTIGITCMGMQAIMFSTMSVCLLFPVLFKATEYAFYVISLCI